MSVWSDVVRAYAIRRICNGSGAALDQGSQEIVGVYVDTRSYQGALMFMAVPSVVCTWEFSGVRNPPEHSMSMCSVLDRYKVSWSTGVTKL